MTAYLSLTSNAPAGTSLTLHNGSTSTGYLRPTGADWGVFGVDSIEASSIDSYGSINVGGGLRRREQRLPLIVEGGGSHATLVSRWNALIQIVASVDASTGVMSARPENGTGVARWEVEAARLEGEYWGRSAELGAFVQVDLVLVVSPTSHAPLDVVDEFSVDTLGTGGMYNLGGSDWTKVDGSASVSVSGGALVSSSVAGATYYDHTGTGLALTDGQVQAKVKISTLVNNKYVGLVVKRVTGITERIIVRALSDGAGAGTLSILTVTAAGGTDTTSTAITTLASDTWYWLVGRIEGNVVHVEWWTTEPSPLGSPTHSTSQTLAADTHATVGKSIAGSQGVVFSTTGSGTVSWDDFRVQGYTYRNWTLPDVLPMNGSVLGDVAAKADITVTAAGSSASASPEWACFAWMPTPAAHNLVWNDGFEVDTNGWSEGAVTNLTNAATSIARSTTYKHEGAASLEIVTPATGSSGAAHRMYRRFKRGVTYTVEAYAYAPSATTAVMVRIGNSAANEKATSTAAALSTTWTRHTTTWTPTADYEEAHVAFITNAATATTFYIDRVMVYEGTTAPTFSAGGQVPFGVINGASVDVTNKGSFFSIASDANYRAGFDLAGTGSMSTNATAEWYLHPWAITPDDYARGEYACKVFARLEIASTQTDLNIVTSLRPEGGTSYGAERYTQEWGSAGKAVTTPGASVFRWVNLGTIVMRVDRTRPNRWKLRMSCTNASTSTGAFGIDQIMLVPARRSVMSMTGANDSDFAAFISSTSQTSKTVKWNKRCEISNPASTVSRHPYPDGGLGGANILLPPGDVQMLAWLADYQPDRADASSDGAGESVSATVSVSVKPQYVLARA